MRPWRRNNTSSIMHFIVTVACERDDDCPYGGEHERCGGECSVGEAACFGRAFVVVWDACSCDEESVCVDAVWGAGHERGLIGGVVALVYPSEIVGGDGADGLHLVGEGFTEGGDGEFIAFAGLVEFGEHEFVGEASVCGDDSVGSCSPDRQGCSRPVSGADGERLFACSVAYG